MPVPPNLVSISAFGTTLLMRTTTDVWLWSGITQTWVSIPSSPSAQTWNFNAYAIVQDGNTYHGFTSRTASVTTVTVGAGAVLTNGPSTSSWTSVLQDGTTAYGFGAFSDGQWIAQPLASAAPLITVGSHAAVVQDGAAVHAFDSNGGAWVSIPETPGMATNASRSTAVAWDATTVWCYSSHRRAWASTAFATATAPTIMDDFVMSMGPSGADLLAYSSLQGTFSQWTLSVGSGPTALQLGRSCAAVVDGTDVVCYAAGVGSFASLPQQTAATVTTASNLIVIASSAGTTAFSGTSGQFSTTLAGSYSVMTNDDVVWAQGTLGSFAYSAIRNVWVTAPNVVVQSAQLLRNAIVLVRQNGYEAFAARSATWFPLNTQATGNFQTSNAGATFVAIDGNAMIVFDSRFGRWSAVITAAAPTVNIWRTTAVANDGVAAYGFGLDNNAWDVKPLIGSVVDMVANSALGYVRTTQFLYVYTDHGTLSTPSRYPEFGRFHARGTDLRLTQVAPEGSSVTMAVSLAPATTVSSYAGYGSIFIDLTQLLLVLPIGTVPAQGILEVSFPIPNDPALNTTQLFIQNIVVTPWGHAWFTSCAAPIII
jgi:hypothetical protein